jgi:hypothetical protein
MTVAEPNSTGAPTPFPGGSSTVFGFRACVGGLIDEQSSFQGSITPGTLQMNTAPRITTRDIVAFLIASSCLWATATAVPASSGQDAPEATGEVAEEAKTRRRVHVVIDRFREVGGEVVAEDELTITIKRDGREETFERNKVLAIVTLLEVKAGGENGTIYMRDGTRLDALVMEDGFTDVTVEVEGIRHQIPRDDVDHVELYPGFEEWLAHVRERIDPNDLEARIDLARWMVENSRLQLARTELKSVIMIDEHPGAKQLLQLVEAKIALDNEGSSLATPLPPKRDRTEGIPERQLTHEDVNIIRVYEIDFSDPPKVSLEPGTIDALVASHSEHPLVPSDIRGREGLNAMRDIDKVKLIFDVKARELYPNIKVESIPDSLSRFRKHVHNTWLIRNCATSGCHGGQNAGRFFLHRTDPTDSRTILENLLIMERLDLGGPHRIIDYEKPEMSLLVQYALPSAEARVPHPEVPGYTPVFPAGESRIRTQTEQWIRSMYQPRPRYPVEFTPPTQKTPLKAPPPPRVPR